MTTRSLVLTAVGDVGLAASSDPDYFGPTREHLSADVSFAQLEGVYSDRGARGEGNPRGVMPRDVEVLDQVAGAGFDVVSLASNHVLDWGQDALDDCERRLDQLGIAFVGTGPDEDSARRAVIVERSGVRIAFLAYCSVAPDSYYASARSGGAAPMRAVTHYEPFEPDQPGTAATTLTFPVAEDLRRLTTDVEAARRSADIVIVSMHWGVRGVRAELADYQSVVAHAAIDAGADLILGHHPHILKGIEVYHGKVILYSIGDFAMDVPAILPTHNPDWIDTSIRIYDRLYGRIPIETVAGKPESKLTAIVRVEIEDARISTVGLIPALIGDDFIPRPIDAQSQQGREFARYVELISAEAGLDVHLVARGSTLQVNGDLL